MVLKKTLHQNRVPVCLLWTMQARMLVYNTTIFTIISKQIFYQISKILKGEMIGKLTLYYNRTRQAVITRELIEIISGAAALDVKE